MNMNDSLEQTGELPTSLETVIVTRVRNLVDGIAHSERTPPVSEYLP